MLPKARTSKDGKCACAARCCTTAVLDRLSGQDRLILTAYSGRSLAVSWQQARAMSEDSISVWSRGGSAGSVTRLGGGGGEGVLGQLG